MTTEEDQFGKLPTSGIQYKNGYTVELSFTRSGTSKISFKSGNKTYTSTVRVLPYTKPLSSLTISGIKNGTTTNLAGKFAKGHWVSVKQPKTQNNGQISIKAASGWKIISAYYMAEGRNFKTNGQEQSQRRIYNRPNINDTRKEDKTEDENKVTTVEVDDADEY